MTGRIVISDDDFADEPSQADEGTTTAAQPEQSAGAARHEPLPADTELLWSGAATEQRAPAMTLPPVREHRNAPHQVRVGSQAPATGAHPEPAGSRPPSLPLNLSRTQLDSIIAALAAIAAGWAVTELFGLASQSGTTEGALERSAGLWVAVIGVIFAVVTVSWDDIRNQEWERLAETSKRSAPAGFVGGFVSGYVAQMVFHALLPHINILEPPPSGRIYLARAIGWAVFGAGMGAAAGFAARSQKKLQNGVFGGVAGGAVGGLVFNWLGNNMSSSQSFARLIGLVFVGGLTALAIGLVEQLRREAWLTVEQGGMEGKEFILYHAVTNIGTSPKCEIPIVKDPDVSPNHLTIAEAPHSHAVTRTLTAAPGCPVFVNGLAINEHRLRSGDAVQVGRTVLRYAERPTAEPS